MGASVRSWLAPWRSLGTLTGSEWRRATWVAVLAFLVPGTGTALWPNPWFIRMTPATPWDYALLAAQAVLLGLVVGIRGPCPVKPATLGGVLALLGYGCVLCNKLLLMLFGAALLLAWFEPLRPLVGLMGVALLAWLLYRRLAGRTEPAPSAATF